MVKIFLIVQIVVKTVLIYSIVTIYLGLCLRIKIQSFLIFLQAFCSELILWRVDPVGPLSKSGGITELARINSQEISAFSDVAWIPTLLPSSTLGSITNSPSACFVGKSAVVFSFVFCVQIICGSYILRRP